MKIFIVQPMNGKSDETIMHERTQVKQHILEKYPYAEFVESFIMDDAPADSMPPLFYLGESIKCLAKADTIYLCDNWDKARGCRIEYQCAKEYGLDTLLI